MSIAAFSTDAGSNASLGFAEGQAPSSLNDGIRGLVTHVRESYNDASWIDYRDGTPGGTYTYVGPTAFKVTGENCEAKYAPGVKVRAIGTTTGTIYGTIISRSYSAPDTLVIVDFAGALANEALSICISVVEPKAVPVALPDFTGGTSGYYTLPGGIIVQWGVATTVQHDQPVAFPITFPNACFGVYPGLRFISTGAVSAVNIYYAAMTTTGFRQVVLQYNGTAANFDVSTADYTYVAIGN